MQDIVLLYVDDSVENDIVFNGFDVVDSILSRLGKCGIAAEAVISVAPEYSGKYSAYPRLFRRSGCDVADWKKLCADYDATNIIRIHADAVFVDFDIISEMTGIHKKYLAEFTYSENLPEGFSCIIVSRELADSIPESDDKMLPLEKVVKSNINQFDVELYYKGPDIRDKRLNFRVTDPREKQILQNIFSLKKEIPAYTEVRELIEKNPQVLYTSPSYYEIEITCNAEITALYSYRNLLRQPRADMTVETFRKIVSAADGESLPYTLCLGGSGDPLVHPNFYEFMKTALNSRLLERLIIETDGLLCNETFLAFLETRKDDRIHVIVDCSGHDSETYSSVHGSDRFETVSSNINAMKSFFGDDSDRFYLQILKINETEKYLDRFYDYWMKQKVSIILQKQNTYLGRLEDRRYYDLSPVERTSCWHLQRDLYVLSDGTAAFCKQDINGEWSDMNINAVPLKEIWENKKDQFLKDYRKEYCLNPDCRKCDEWYTFNF